MAKMLQELQEIIKKEPVKRVKDYLEIRDDAKKLIDASGEKLEDIAKALASPVRACTAKRRVRLCGNRRNCYNCSSTSGSDFRYYT